MSFNIQKDSQGRVVRKNIPTSSRPPPLTRNASLATAFSVFSTDITSLKLNNTVVTATATELDKTITTPGIAEPNKIMVLDANRNISNISNITCNGITIGGKSLGGSSGQSNQFLNNINAGIVEPNKVIAPDNNNNLTNLNNVITNNFKVQKSKLSINDRYESNCNQFNIYEMNNTYNWVGMCWATSLNIFVAISDNGIIMSSPDGITWTNQETPVVNNWTSICWSTKLNLFVVVSNTGIGNRVLTSNDGINWISRTTPVDNNWSSVCWSNELNLFVAVASNENVVMTSNNGIVWNTRNINNIVNVDLNSGNSLQSIEAGESHSLFIKNDGTVFASGLNDFGQLGDETTVQKNTFIQIPRLYNVLSVSAGLKFSLALLNTGIVKSWGLNSSGQLGNNSTTNSSIPVNVLNLENPIAISAGATHALALLANGTIRAWGSNTNGELGNENNSQQNSNVAVSNINNAIAISAGNNFSLALLKDGTIKSWGQNNFGQLGNNSTTSSNIPVNVSNITNAIAISASSGSHALALLSNGNVMSWGYNNVGQLGNSTLVNSSIPVLVGNINNAIKIKTSFSSSFALLSDGTVSSWGQNNLGQLGNNSTTNSSVPVIVSNSSNIIDLVCGSNHTLALLNDGSLQYWGSNANGQLGDSTTTNKLIISSNTVTPLTNIRTNFTLTKWNSICWSPSLNLFVAVAGGENTSINRVMTSTNGINWNLQLATEYNNWSSVCWASDISMFLAVSDNGNNRVMTSTNGINWSSQISHNNQWRQIVWSNRFNIGMAISNNNTNSPIMITTNGTNWLPISLDIKKQLNCISWSPILNKFCILSNNNNPNIYFSKWQLAPAPIGTITTGTINNISNTCRDVKWIPELNMFIVVGLSGKVLTSTNGNTWNVITTISSSLTINSIAFSPSLNLLVAVCNSQTYLTSPDGINWTSRTGLVNYNWISITWGNNMFVAIAQTPTSANNAIMTSTNGTDWISRTAINNSSWNKVKWINNLNIFMAVSSTTTDRIMTSSNGINWNLQSASLYLWSDFAYSPSLNLIVTVSLSPSHTNIITSNDGFNWTTRLSPLTTISSIIWVDSLQIFIAISNSNSPSSYMVSSNGIDWQVGFFEYYQNYVAIDWSPSLNKFVAVSSNTNNENIISSVVQTSNNTCLSLLTQYNSNKELKLNKLIDNIYYDKYLVKSYLNAQWNPVLTNNSVGWKNIAWYETFSRFIAINNNNISISSDGITWSNSAAAVDTLEYKSIAISEELKTIVVVGARNPHSNNLIRYSTSTSNFSASWSTSSTTNIESLSSVCWSPELSLFVAVSNMNNDIIKMSNNMVSNTDNEKIITQSDAYNNSSTWSAWNGFNGTIWHTNSRYLSSTGMSTSNVITNGINNDQFIGDWMQIEFYKPITLYSFIIYPSSSFRDTRSVKAFSLLGSNTANSDWTIVYSDSGLSWPTGTNSRIYNLSNLNSQYKYYRLVVHQIMGGDTYLQTYYDFYYLNLDNEPDLRTNRILTSPNGQSWSLYNSPKPNAWNSICWASELTLFVAVSVNGINDQVMTSSDGIHWISRYTPVNNQWTSVCWSPYLMLFVAVASSGNNNRIMTSSNGINWTIRTSPVNSNWNSVIWNSEYLVFLATASNNQKIMYSFDGINWKLIQNNISDNINSIMWSDAFGKFLISTNDNILSSDISKLNTQNLLLNKTFYFDNNSLIIGRNNAVTTHSVEHQSDSLITFGSNSTIITQFNNSGGRLILNESGGFINFSDHNGIDSGLAVNNQLILATGEQINSLFNAKPNTSLPLKIVISNNNNNVSVNNITCNELIIPSAFSQSSNSILITDNNNNVSGINNVNLQQLNINNYNLTCSNSVKLPLTFTVRSIGDANLNTMVWSDKLSMLMCSGSNTDASISNIAYSYDGENWITNSSFSSYPFNTVTWSPTLSMFLNHRTSSYVIVNSYDGINWNVISPSGSGVFVKLLWSNTFSRFYGLVDQTLSIFQSNDGSIWNNNSHNTGSSTSPSNLIEVNNNVIGCYNTFIAYTSNGNTWTNATIPQCRSIAYSPTLNLYVAACNSSFRTSTNLSSWTNVFNTAADMNTILWINELSMFIASSTSSTNRKLWYSYDGINWYIYYINQNFTISNLFWSTAFKRLYILTSTNFMLISDIKNKLNYNLTPNNLLNDTVVNNDAGLELVNNWISRTVISTGWNSICRGNGLFVAISSTNIITSPNGITWTTRSLPVNNYWTDIIYSSQLQLFVAVANTGNNDRIITSSNGIDWTIQVSPSDSNWASIAYSNQLGLFVAISNMGDHYIMTSSDGINWVTQLSPANNIWNAICWSDELEMFVAVAGSGDYKVMTSSDGINWILRSAPNRMWSSVCWCNNINTFIAVSTGNSYFNNIMTSNDGINWNIQFCNNRVNWRKIIWINELNMAVAISNKSIMVSFNGYDWSLQNTNTVLNSNNWWDICWASDIGILCAVGSTNKFATSIMTFPTKDNSIIAYPNQLTIDNVNSRVGLGVSAPTFQLQLSNDSAFKLSTSTWNIFSDSRLKHNIQNADLDECYNNIKNLPLKKYKWKDSFYNSEQVYDRTRLGWIADEVQQIFPNSVKEIDAFGFSDCKTLNNDQIIASLYGTIQKLISISESQKNKIDNLTSLLNNYKNIIYDLEVVDE